MCLTLMHIKDLSANSGLIVVGRVNDSPRWSHARSYNRP
jgi:hypothetical protein